MLAAIVSFTFVDAAVVSIVSGGNVGGGGRNGDMEEMNAYTTISLNRLTAIRVLARSKNSHPVGFLL